MPDLSMRKHKADQDAGGAFRGAPLVCADQLQKIIITFGPFHHPLPILYRQAVSIDQQCPVRMASRSRTVSAAIYLQVSLADN